MTEPTTTTGIGDRDTSQVAREQGRQIKGTARDAASDVATTAGERTRDLREQAASHVRGITAEARRQLRDRVEQETEHAGGALSRAGSQLQALAEGRTDEAGVFGEYAEQVAQTVNRWADSIQDRGLDGLLDDLRSVGRRRPGAFLVGAMAAGMIAGRFGRSLRQEMSESSDREPGAGSNTLVPGPAAASGQTDDRYLTTERTAEVEVPVRSMP
jgi:gas vesicle protein